MPARKYMTMISRFRTYAAVRDRASSRTGGGSVAARLCAAAARAVFFCAFLFLYSLGGSPAASWAAVPAGTAIDNSAQVTFKDGPFSLLRSAVSNTVTVTTVALRTAAVIEFLQYAPAHPGAQPVVVRPTEWSPGGGLSGPFVALPAPVPAGSSTALDLSQPVQLITAVQYHMGEPVFIRLTDLDQNVDPLAAETVVVTVRNDSTGDAEVLRLTETGPNTGVFVGFVQSSGDAGAGNDGLLNVVNQSTVRVSYVDAYDATDTDATAALVDPFGLVINSATGQLVNGAVITLINAATGSPATVYGDDGVSAYPATVTTGSVVTDGSGRVYSMTTGGYRFPFIQPGTYRLALTPPAGYRAPSTVPDGSIQALPGGPFILVQGSRGEDFIVNAGPAIRIDLPIDPVGSQLYLVKTAGKQNAAAGDFVPYALSVENTDTTAPATGVTILDRLPHGFRYQKGSARMNASVLADPTIAEDGRNLSFVVGDLAAGGKAEVRYVAAIGAGARPGKAVNSAVARGSGGIVSNSATATVLVTEDLLRSKAYIVGRVFEGCGEAEGGVAGVRIYLEDGTYTVTDKNGMFHFEAVKPGTHVVQLDTYTVPETHEILSCEENTRFAGTPFSQFVDLQGGALWRADFHLGLKPRASGEVRIELRSVLEQAGKKHPEGALVAYSVPIQVGTVAVRNPRLTIVLPEGVTYTAGSAQLNDGPLGDPEIEDGALTFRMADVPADWEGTVRFDAVVAGAGESGTLVTQAVLTVDTPKTRNVRTPAVDNMLVRERREEQRALPDIVLRPNFPTLSAELTVKDKKQIDKVIKDLRKLTIRSITITGHTDGHAIRGKGRQKFADNYVLSRARAQAVADYLAPKLDLAREQMTIIGKGPDAPVAGNDTAEGRARNRRVEFKVETRSTVQSSEIRNEKDASGVKTAATEGLRPGEEWPAAGARDGKSGGRANTMPDYDAAWVENARPGLEWLWPAEGFYPSIPSVKVAIKHDPRRTVKLLLNGNEVEALYFDGKVQNASGTIAVSVWRGVNIGSGDNTFAAVEYDERNAETARIQRMMHYSTPPVKAALAPERSRLEADGKRPPVLAIRLTDKDGHPAREGLIGEFSLDPPYLPRKRGEHLQQSPLNDSASSRMKYSVGEDGVALIELQPTMRSGEAVVRIPLSGGEQEVRAWLRPEDRDWILVGLAEGTVGYNVATGNMESLGAAGQDERYYDEGRVAFYAKGKVKGEWLLTMAYDSAKQTSDGRPGLYQTIDPNQYYMLYGDAAEQQYDAASSKKIYVKLERDQFYALFGDFPTGLSLTELSRYSRSMTGFKSELKGKRFEYTAFASENSQAFVKDEIRGDGTSGLYRLSRKNIVLNSEQIMIETRDRFRSEAIITQQRMTRHLDYTIDYESGTIWFKSPVFSRDGNFNPIFIVVEYEAFDASDKAYTYGGRAAVKLGDDRLVLGATHVHEGRTGGEGELQGVDAAVDLGGGTKVRAEVATTKTEQAGTTTDGSAYLAEVQHRSDRIEGKAYVREQEAGFGLGQQNGSETGTRKIGGDLLYRINTPWSIGTEVFRQETLTTGAMRDLVELRGRYTMPRYEAQLGIRHVEDTLGTGEMHTSDQLFSSMRYQFTDRLAGRVQHDQSLGSGDSLDFPTRTTVGMDIRLNRSAILFADQEFTRSATEDTSTSRVGLKATPWNGGQLSSTVEQQTTENGVRLFSTTGLKQTWKVTERWSLDGGLDRTSTFRHPGDPPLNTNVPPASGSSEDFTAVTLGAGYRQERWSWTGRVEHRTSESEDKISTFTGANGQVTSGLALAAGLQTFRTVAAAGTTKFNGDLRFGVAYRPFQTRFIILDRLDLLQEEQSGPETSYDNWRIINNYVMNIKHDSRTQFSVQYGAKYVKEAIENDDYRGFTDLTGLEGRYDITKKWDIGIRGLMLNTRILDQVQYGAGASMGFHAGRNIWMSVGYNFTGFRDRDFSKADFTSEGPFIKLRMKFDQVSMRDAVKWFTGQ